MRDAFTPGKLLNVTATYLILEGGSVLLRSAAGPFTLTRCLTAASYGVMLLVGLRLFWSVRPAAFYGAVVLLACECATLPLALLWGMPFPRATWPLAVGQWLVVAGLLALLLRPSTRHAISPSPNHALQRTGIGGGAASDLHA